jgi:flagellar basal body rod protein FlgC
VTEFSALSAAAAGMEAQRAALDIDARNVAAAETGQAFDRLVPRFAIAQQNDVEVAALDEPEQRVDDAQPFIRFTGTTTERGTGVDAITEMVAVLNAQRAYEADASVFEAGKRLAERTIDVGRA